MYQKKNPTIIIDGSLYLYTSYYGFRNFKNISGKPFGAIYGVLKMIDNILKKYNNSKKIIIVFDSYQPTFRKKIFKKYKSNRSSMPDLLSMQIQPLFKILEKIGIKILSIPGIEADDIIGSLACKLEEEGEKIIIVSHDKDMLQLVTKNINVFNKKKNSIITPEVINIEYGIRPKEYIDFLALIGDTSDNIPGVPKIGVKTALILLKQFSNIHNIYSNISKIPLLSFRNAKNITIQLQNYKKIAFLSHQLAAIQLDIPISIKSEDMLLKQHVQKKLFQFLKTFYYQTY
ncbi:5'-3' exonuclease [Buchnera aphidicola (Hyadaphis tataricae)]|uniref:5'-3' exonuclease n=1 Tax=Buchnera aphidicola (Hyadaphis tataricae) TaxID=1241859 RepID=A0A4D6XZI4_9GAMM|nr:5'-3' exonuclease [Buchnera aphidicola]QCI21717.1 5'-3' exonuclease [Buchnera aphidicola (Hyadaphis tataricae)]